MSSPIRPSVCLSSVTFVRPTQAIEIFGNVSTPNGVETLPKKGTLATCRHPGEVLPNLVAFGVDYI